MAKPPNHADVNGLMLCYREHGDGGPGGGPAVILLHGGLGSGDMFQAILPELTDKRRVITVDLQGHGRTPDVDRPLRYESMADDIAALVEHLGLGQADVMGYSLGGGVALRMAIQHPELVRRLVLVSVPFRGDAFFPEVRASMRQMGPDVAELMKQSPPYQDYAQVAPRVEDWPVLVTKTGELVSGDYDWAEQVAGITAPTLLVYADADSFSPVHMAEFYRLLGGGHRDAGWEGSGLPPRPASQLAILPGRTHYDVWLAPALPAAVNGFLG